MDVATSIQIGGVQTSTSPVLFSSFPTDFLQNSCSLIGDAISYKYTTPAYCAFAMAPPSFFYRYILTPGHIFSIPELSHWIYRYNGFTYAGQMLVRCILADKFLLNPTKDTQLPDVK